MWKAIKLALIYYVMQVLGVLLVMPFVYGYLYASSGTIDAAKASEMLTPPGMLMGVALMAFYLWRKRYITKKTMMASATTAQVNYTMFAGFGLMFLLDVLTTYLQVPDIMEASFDMLQSGIFGILYITILGPIMEELLFRGAIMKVLSKKFNPAWTIVISALIFGLIHVNPIQVVAASISGLLFGLVYYTTRSLWPCIFLHIVNNSISTYISIRHPEMESVTDLMSGYDVLFWVFVSTVLVVFSVRGLWKSRKSDEVVIE